MRLRRLALSIGCTRAARMPLRPPPPILQAHERPPEVLVAAPTSRVASRCSDVVNFMSLALQAEAEEANATRYLHGELKQGVDFADLNRDGVLDKSEFKRLLKELGLDWNSERVQQIFERIDLNKDGFMQLAEWHAALHTVLIPNFAPNPSHAFSAEAQEAEETGYSGMLGDSQVLMDKLREHLVK